MDKCQCQKENCVELYFLVEQCLQCFLDVFKKIHPIFDRRCQIDTIKIFHAWVKKYNSDCSVRDEFYSKIELFLRKNNKTKNNSHSWFHEKICKICITFILITAKFHIDESEIPYSDIRSFYYRIKAKHFNSFFIRHDLLFLDDEMKDIFRFLFDDNLKNLRIMELYRIDVHLRRISVIEKKVLVDLNWDIYEIIKLIY